MDFLKLLAKCSYSWDFLMGLIAWSFWIKIGFSMLVPGPPGFECPPNLAPWAARRTLAQYPKQRQRPGTHIQRCIKWVGCEKFQSNPSRSMAVIARWECRAAWTGAKDDTRIPPSIHLCCQVSLREANENPPGSRAGAKYLKKWSISKLWDTRPDTLR